MKGFQTEQASGAIQEQKTDEVSVRHSKGCKMDDVSAYSGKRKQQRAFAAIPPPAQEELSPADMAMDELRRKFFKHSLVQRAEARSGDMEAQWDGLRRLWDSSERPAGQRGLDGAGLGATNSTRWITSDIKFVKEEASDSKFLNFLD